MQGVKEVRVGVVEKNIKAMNFWKKNGFFDTGIVSKEELYNVKILVKEL